MVVLAVGLIIFLSSCNTQRTTHHTANEQLCHHRYDNASQSILEESVWVI